MTSEQLRMAYRYAVERCLVVFFDLQPRDATAAAASWWGRITAGQGLRSGLFLHAEAIDTAADLARSEEVPLSEANGVRYRAVLEEASLRAMTGSFRDEVAANVLPDREQEVGAPAPETKPSRRSLTTAQT